METLRAKKRNSDAANRILIGALILLTCGIGCTPLIARYDPFSYQEAVSLKVDALDLLSHATNPASQYEQEIKSINRRLSKIYEYEKGKPQNDVTANLWAVLIDPEKGLYGGLIKEWQPDNKLSNPYLTEKIKQIGKAFDIIIRLETKKISDRKLEN